MASYRPVILLGTLTLFTIYSFGYASLVTDLDYKVLLSLSFLMGLEIIRSGTFSLSKSLFFLYIAFLGSSVLSCLISEHAEVDRLIESLAVLLLSSVIVFGFKTNQTNDIRVMRWGLFGILAILALSATLFHLGIPIKQNLPNIAGFQSVSHEWNQKYFSFWLSFLLWGVVALNWKKGRLHTASTVLLIILTGFALFMGYSDSAKLAFFISLLVFVFTHFFRFNYLLFWYVLIASYVFLFPLIWNILPSQLLLAIKSLPLNNVSFRVDLYVFCSQLILKQLWTGYGFGSVAYVLQPFPIHTGGHPHNFVLYFWLELGMLGAAILYMALIILITFIHNITLGQDNSPAIWALVSTGITIFSFSFDIWLPGIALLCSFWLAMIVLACQGCQDNIKKCSNIQALPKVEN